MEPIYLQLEYLQPSQFYLNTSKLQAVLETFEIDSLEPLPVREIKGKYTLTDGHHTAFVALLMGCSKVKVTLDTDDMDWEAYERFVEECRKRSVYSLSDLVGRLLTHEKYQELWIEWCNKFSLQLEKERALRQGLGNKE